VIAIPALVMASPVIAAAAIAVKLESRGPVIYRGARVGRHGKEFRILKLRSMVAAPGPWVTAADDARMSLVGPRPEDPNFVRLYTPEQRRVLSVRPGITSQTSLEFAMEERLLAEHGVEAYSKTVMPRKLARDLEYVDHHSIGGDLRILGRTLGFALSRLAGRQQ
jgi:lipopolysaccharide/colanic/teichoic acid biosynthesis glycosyltransferase